MKKALIFTNILTLSLLVGYWAYKKNPLPPKFPKQLCTYSFADIQPLINQSIDSATIIMLGDSRIKQGNWQQLLNRNHIANFGINGDKAYCLCDRLSPIKKTQAKICFIEGGVMDLYTEKPDSIVNSFKKIVSFCKQNNVIPVVNGIVKISSKASPLYKEANTKIDDINNKLVIYTKQNKIDYIDLNPQLVSNIDQVLSNKFTVDGAHFNDEAYKIWAVSINEILIKYHLCDSRVE